MKSLLISFLFVFTFKLLAQENETLKVELSNPGKQGHLHAGVITGSIKVSSHAGNDVIISTNTKMEMKKENNHRNPKAGNMKKINSGRGFNIVAEENNNIVEVSANPSFEGELNIKVPKNFSLQLSTVNDGDIVIENVEGSHELSNVNGDIIATKIGGSVMATTVNGDISVTMSNVTSDSPLAFTNLNGDIMITLPTTANFNVQAASDNGDIYSDFEVKSDQPGKKIMTSKVNGEHKISKTGGVSFKINNGGPDMMITSMNGDIMIKKM